MPRYIPSDLPYVVPSAGGPETLEDVLSASRFADDRANRTDTGGILPHYVEQRLTIAPHDRGPYAVGDASAYADAPIHRVDSVSLSGNALNADSYELDGERLILHGWTTYGSWKANLILAGIVGHGRLVRFGEVRQEASATATSLGEFSQQAGQEGAYAGVAGRVFLIDDEMMYESDEGGAVALVRGANGTDAAVHAVGAVIYRVRAHANVESGVRTLARRDKEIARVAADQRGAQQDFGLPATSALFSNLSRTFTRLRPARYTDWTTE